MFIVQAIQTLSPLWSLSWIPYQGISAVWFMETSVCSFADCLLKESTTPLCNPPSRLLSVGLGTAAQALGDLPVATARVAHRRQEIGKGPSARLELRLDASKWSMTARRRESCTTAATRLPQDQHKTCCATNGECIAVQPTIETALSTIAAG